VKKKTVSLLLLIFLLSTNLVFASDDVFDKYGVRKDIRISNNSRRCLFKFRY